MSSQSVDFFRPWNSSDNTSKKEEDSKPIIIDDIEPKQKKITIVDCTSMDDCCTDDSESDSSSLAGSSSSYNSIDSELSTHHHHRHHTTPITTTPKIPIVNPIACQEIVYPTAYPHPIWDHHHHPLNPVDAVYFNGIAAEVDRLHQQEMVAKQIKKTRPKNFACNYCSAAFSNNGQLKGHLRTHTGEKPFRCNAEGCSRAFTRNEELTRHKRIHTGLKPFVCDLCQKKFGRKDHLKKHFKTHNRYANAAECDFAYMATLLSGHYYGYYPPPPTAAAAATAAYGLV